MSESFHHKEFEPTASCPLDGVRVLDLSRLVSGNMISLQLADFGAEVIKVEDPKKGDPLRHWDIQDQPTAWKVYSRNKKSITLDLRSSEGSALLLQLVEEADVFIENFRPGTLEKTDFPPDKLMQTNPNLILVRVSGWGQTGPYKDLPAHDHQIQAMSGIMDMNGAADGPPTRVGFFVGDLVTPLYAAYSILGALRVKEKTGQGQYLDASMIDTLATLMFMEPVEHILDEGKPPRAGNDARHDVTGLYRLTDGDVIITVGSPLRWEKLCRALDAENLLNDPRYATNAGRQEHVDTLRQAIQQRLGRHNCVDGIALLEGAGVPVARVRTLPEAVNDRHFRDRGTLKPMYRYGSSEAVEPGIISGFPIAFSGGELPKLDGGAPLGQHNAEIFGKLLNLDELALQNLKKNGVI